MGVLAPKRHPVSLPIPYVGMSHLKRNNNNNNKLRTTALRTRLLNEQREIKTTPERRVHQKKWSLRRRSLAMQPARGSASNTAGAVSPAAQPRASPAKVFKTSRLTQPEPPEHVRSDPTDHRLAQRRASKEPFSKANVSRLVSKKAPSFMVITGPCGRLPGRQPSREVFVTAANNTAAALRKTRPQVATPPPVMNANASTEEPVDGSIWWALCIFLYLMFAILGLGLALAFLILTLDTEPTAEIDRNTRVTISSSDRLPFAPGEGGTTETDTTIVGSETTWSLKIEDNSVNSK